VINFDVFKLARKKYTENCMPFLCELRNIAQDKKIYQGLKILHNTPLTMEAVLKIEILLLGGAEVTASCISILPPDLDAVDILKSANVEVQIEHDFKKTYDFHLDCCGELLNISPPKIGAVELTQTGSKLYKKSNCLYPIVSVDDSPLKLLETILGTGDGFLRALRYKFGHDIYDKKFILFGFGKVGRGIAHSLMKFTDKIVAIDRNEESMKMALKCGIKYINSTNRKGITKELRDSSFIVCATGVKNLMTDFYSFNKFDLNKAILVNMGAYDEYGDNFCENEVLFGKKPFNFSISEPTTMKYLDPIFYAHNLGVELILSKRIGPGYNAFPDNLAREILKKWSIIYQEEFFEVEAYFY
jgi:adenosylhomocysteinase